MSKLLRANMARLWKNRAFRLCFLLLAAFGAVQRVGLRMDKEPHCLDETFWINALAIGVFLSVFISLFIGAEFDEGTIRNKIVIGHTHSAIYLANTAVCILAGWLMSLGYLASSLLVGIPLLGFFHTGLPTIFLQGVCVFALSAAYAAIYCFVAMLSPSRAVTAIVCILLSFLLLFAGTAVSNRLDESEYYYIPTEPEEFLGMDDPQNFDLIPNPYYLEETERPVYSTLMEVLPGGQSLQLSGMLDESRRYGTKLLASLGWVILSGCCGVLLFQKRDLR